MSAESAQAEVPYKRRSRPGTLTRVMDPRVLERLCPEDFPTQMELLARDIANLLECFNEFPEFTDEALDVSVSAFCADLRVCLRSFL